jgi:hypothetical protein
MPTFFVLKRLSSANHAGLGSYEEIPLVYELFGHVQTITVQPSLHLITSTSVVCYGELISTAIVSSFKSARANQLRVTSAKHPHRRNLPGSVVAGMVRNAYQQQF